MQKIKRQIMITICCIATVSCIAVIALCIYSARSGRQSSSSGALVAGQEDGGPENGNVDASGTEDSDGAFLAQMTEMDERQPVSEETEQNESEAPEELERETLSALVLSAKRISSSQIELSWSDTNAALIDYYVIERCDNRKAADDAGWQTVGEVKAKEAAAGNSYRFTDSLLSKEPQQYVYRIIPKTVDGTRYDAPASEQVLCSNICICIDPGHYAGKNAVESDRSYGYAEGDFTLLLSLELCDVLEQKYGIATCLTRNSGSITLSGYTDEDLDSAHISLRGSYAATMGCDLFMSVHTNSNQDDANGAATFEQSISINKPMVIANSLAISSEEVLSICNSIGENLAETNYELGTSAYREFIPASKETAREWTVDYNDSTEEMGTVVYRHGSKGEFYGVLRGAQNSGIPGIIVEHGYHSVPQMREAAMTGNLKSQWARDDADGIAAGYGFQVMR
ncbi:MAG: N-acetylmuramoyl-L-alanine amidase [Roseburia sp.]|nr:N-acetylmuramoyl-L-alanine amidase [Roseburia sp.]